MSTSSYEESNSIIAWFSQLVSEIYSPFLDHCGTINRFNLKDESKKVQWTVPAKKTLFFLLKRGAERYKHILCSPDFEKPFILQTDASELGLGAVLVQKEDEGRHPVFELSIISQRD